jgi:hypothetical protein
MAGTIKKETKKEGQRKAKRHTTRRNQEKRRKLVPFVVGGNCTHDPSNVVCMQIVKFSNNGRSRTNITYQHNLFICNRGESMLKSNINMLLEKLNAKRQG